ncbi:MAG: histone deacetylase family protein [Pseudomonadota bacterium]
MKTFYNAQHALHQGKVEMFRGQLVPCFEVPSRQDHVFDALKSRALGPVEAAPDFPEAAITRIHSQRYVDFLKTAWDEWVALDPANAQRDALPSVWPVRTFRSDKLPDNFAARMGLFSYDAGSPLTSGTWMASRAGAHCALAAAREVQQGARGAFALSRPPGHHAGTDFFGGYCFLNNAAIAAQSLRDAGLSKVAILDIDYHHGNGTQAIFYGRGDVFFASIHGDPRTEYPFFLGHADERGEGDGAGCNLNLPLPKGTAFVTWREAMAAALKAIAAFKAEAIVVSLGVDTFAGDPISGFRLQSADYLRVGEDIARARLPTVFVFEGGYAVEEIGVNAVNVLEGFQNGV